MSAERLPLEPVLAQVSRSFYLSLRLLPALTRRAVGLAYLLARLADTVADTRAVPRHLRLELLRGLLETYRAGGPAPELAQRLTGFPASEDVTPGERALLGELPLLLRLLAESDDRDRARVLDVVATLIGGMVLDLERFPGEFEGELVALERGDELHDYCYRVAGCVGEFWSWIHLDHLRSLRRVDPQAWAADGVRLGHALQLTNVLRDIPRDLRHGRCYLPLADLEPAGLTPRQLLEPARWEALRPVFAGHLRTALAHADAGLRYVLATPSREPRLRLAGALPLLLAVRTLGVVWAHNPLDPAAPRKVARREVYELLARAGLGVREDARLIALYRRVRRRSGFPLESANACIPKAER